MSKHTFRYHREVGVLEKKQAHEKPDNYTICATHHFYDLKRDAVQAYIKRASGKQVVNFPRDRAPQYGRGK